MVGIPFSMVVFLLGEDEAKELIMDLRFLLLKASTGFHFWLRCSITEDKLLFGVTLSVTLGLVRACLWTLSKSSRLAGVN